MKIAQVSTVHRGDDVRIQYKMASSLSAAGHDVLVIGQPAGATETPVPVDVIPPERHRALRMTRGVWRALRRVRRFRPDAVQLHDPELFLLIPLLRLLRIKVVVDLHEDLPAQIADKHWIAKPIRSAVAAATRLAYRLLLPGAHRIIVAAPALAEDYARYGPVLVANYPVLDTEPTPRRPGTRTVAYIGGLSKRRGIREMMEAVRRIDGARLVLAGRFEPAELEAEAQEWDGWDVVDFRGWLDRTRVQSLLSEAAVGLAVLHPTRQHLRSHPLKLFEYMAAGLPVVAADFPDWRSIIAELRCGLVVDPLDVAAIADAIGEILDDPAMAAAMGARGRKAVESEFAWRHQERRLLDLYESLS